MKSILTSLIKSILLPWGISAGKSEADAAIQKKIYGSGRLYHLASLTIALIISNDKMDGIIRIIKSLEDSGLLV